VSPALRTFEIFELGVDGRYVKALGTTGGVLTDVPGCAKLTLDLDALWEEANRLESEAGEGTKG
jgi:hypothetical protein